MSQDARLHEKLLVILNEEYENYVYKRSHFYLVQEDEGIVIKGWTLDIVQPSYEEIEAIVLPS